MNVFVAVFFKILNFALLCGILYYIFKKYMQTSLQGAMLHDQAIIPHLEREKKDLLQQEKNSIIAGEQQEALARTLQQKIIVWQQQMQIYHQQREEQRERLQKSLQKLQDLQQDFRTLYTLHKEVIPSALDQTKKQLEHLAQTTDLGSRWINNSIQTLEKMS